MRIVTVVLPLVVALTACVSRVGPEPAPTTSPTSSSASPMACIEVTGDPGEEPEVTLDDDCTPPATLLIQDLVPGDGPRATNGSDLTVNYVLLTWSDGEQRESTWDTAPFTTTNLGGDGLIPGWNKGLLGIREGGRRLVVIPPADAYGSTGSGPIGPNETLVFVIDAVTVTG